MTNYEVKTEDVARGYMNGQFVTVHVTLDNGNGKTIDAFEGTIDYVAEEVKAGHPIRSKMLDNYKIINWLPKYKVTWIPAPYALKNEYAYFDNLADAVKFYISRNSNWKTIRQYRKLVDGSEDTNVIAYRWN